MIPFRPLRSCIAYFPDLMGACARRFVLPAAGATVAQVPAW